MKSFGNFLNEIKPSKYTVHSYVTHEPSNQYNVKKENHFDAENSDVAKHKAKLYWAKLGYVVHHTEHVK